MADAKINETCIIGLPSCGYAFGSSRMAFVAAPSDDEFRLELNILEDVLKERNYESYIALQRIDPAKFAFCTKICSKIITSQFCIALLNRSAHREKPEVQIPNPNVHLEYGMMLAFKKRVYPFVREGDDLAFNIQPLDSIVYTKANFKEKAIEAIEDAVLTFSKAAPQPTFPGGQDIFRYMAIRGVYLADVTTDDGRALYRLGSNLGFFLLDGAQVIYLGPFTSEEPREVAFRAKMLLQILHGARERFEAETRPRLDMQQIEHYERLFGKTHIEVIVGESVDKAALEARIVDLTKGLRKVPLTLVTEEDIRRTISAEYESLGKV